MKRLAPAVLSSLAVSATLAAQPEASRFERYVFETRSGERIDSELGRFRVPENRGRRGSRSIELEFVRLKATGAAPGAPIVFLAGGPGSSGIDAARGPGFALYA